MRITKYKTELNDDRIGQLVKESSANYPELPGFNAPEKIKESMNMVFNLKNQTEEYVYLLAMNNKNKLIGIFEISHGNDCSSHCGSREIFNKLLLIGAHSFVIVHNHPSGNPTPSTSDDEVYKRIKEASNIIGVIFLDSIIVGNDYYYSYHEEGM